MTDRERFETKALENGAIILEATNVMLKVLSSNGLMITTYQFDNNGKFEKISH